MLSEPTHQQRLAAIGQTLCVVVLSAFTTVIGKLTLREVSPFTFVWLQVAIGGTLLTLHTFLIRREHLPRGLPRLIWLYIIAIGVGNFCIVRLLFTYALAHLPATTHAYLVNFVGILTMLVSIIMLNERPAPVQVAGALLAIAGLRVFFADQSESGEWIGVVYAGTGITILAFVNNIARRLALYSASEHAAGGPRRGPSSTLVTTLSVWIGGGPVVVAGILTDFPPRLANGTNAAIIALSGLVSIAIGMTVWNYILRTLRSYEASILAASGIIFTALFAIPVLGEPLHGHQIAGIIIMLAGLGLVQIRTRVRAETTHPEDGG